MSRMHSHLRGWFYQAQRPIGPRCLEMREGNTTSLFQEIKGKVKEPEMSKGVLGKAKKLVGGLLK